MLVDSAVVARGAPGSAAVAAGSRAVADAAAQVLARGGTAVDAVVAAGFAAAMAEPALSSLGGGGFLHYWPDADADPVVLDFFVDSPGRGAPSTAAPHVQTVVVRFGDTAVQVFHAGWGTVAVPGCFAGYLEAHRRWGRLPLADVVAPALALAADGIDLDPVQVQFLHVVADLLAVTPESAAAYAGAQATGRFANPAYAALLAGLADGSVSGPDDPSYVAAVVAAMESGGGRVTVNDLASYRPVTRRPVMARRGAARVWANPPPSFGGAIVLDALGTAAPTAPVDWAGAARALLAATLRQRDRDLAAEAGTQVSRGTTHVSVVDAEGRLAAMTTSNGSGSGTMVDGVQLNNMLGEEDLNAAVRHGGPDAVHELPPGLRMGSMMSPTMVRTADGARIALGTGGSERIRSALLGVLLRVLDVGTDLADAVAAPRLHAAPELIDVEPGFGGLEGLDLPVRIWPAPDLYFGGVHGVRIDADGSVEAVGDPRRGGAVVIVD